MEGPASGDEWERLAAQGRVLTAVRALPQTQLKTQNGRIEQLFHKVAQQQRHLEKQQLKIEKLQSQVRMPGPGLGEARGERQKLVLWACTQSQPDLTSSFCPVQVSLLAPMHLGHRMAKPGRRKRLPKMAQLAGPAHNTSRLHSECPAPLLSVLRQPLPPNHCHTPTYHFRPPPCPLHLTEKRGPGPAVRWAHWSLVKG